MLRAKVHIYPATFFKATFHNGQCLLSPLFKIAYVDVAWLLHGNLTHDFGLLPKFTAHKTNKIMPHNSE